MDGNESAYMLLPKGLATLPQFVGVTISQETHTHMSILINATMISLIQLRQSTKSAAPFRTSASETGNSSDTILKQTNKILTVMFNDSAGQAKFL